MQVPSLRPWIVAQTRYRQWIQPWLHPLIKWLDRWIHPWITRANGTYALGGVLLVQGAKNEWYHLPPEAVAAFQTSQFWLQQAPRLGTALFIVLGLLWLLWQRPNIIPRLPYWGGLLAALLFPFFLTTAAPTITYLATSYTDQNLEVVRHVEKKFPDVQAQWKQNISFDQTRPITSIFTFKIEDRSFFQFSAWERVVLDGFGYRNAVFDFIGKGWGMTIAGLVLSLMGVYLQHRHQALYLFHRDMGIFGPVAGVLLGTIVLYLIGINVAQHQLTIEMGRGHYQTVIQNSQRLAQLYPPLNGDEAFLRQWATASRYGNSPRPALIAFTQGSDRYRVGDLFNAKTYFELALRANPKLFLARGYLAATWINEGVEYSKISDRPKLPVYTVPLPKKNNFLDSVQSNERPNVLRIAGAIQNFETALEIFPNHIAALYDLMLAQVMNGDFEASAQTARHHISVQDYFQKANVALLGQAYLHQSWADYHAEELDAAWQRYRQSHNSKAWGEEIERSEIGSD